MSTALHRANLPPALVTQVYEAIGEGSMQWEKIDQAGVFKSTQAAQVAGELCTEIARAWDAREKPLDSHLRNLSYNLGQLLTHETVRTAGAWEHHLAEARRAVDNIRDMLEQPR